MSVMTIFDVVIAGFGVYMIGAALQMKKSGVISPVIITQEEIAKCRDKKGFIADMYWKEALFGVVVALAGVLGFVNEQIVSLGAVPTIQMVVFLGAFLWFQSSLRRAREKFL